MFQNAYRLRTMRERHQVRGVGSDVGVTVRRERVEHLYAWLQQRLTLVFFEDGTKPDAHRQLDARIGEQQDQRRQAFGILLNPAGRP